MKIESYRDKRDDLSDTDVLLFRGKGLSSAAIRWLSGSEYSHVGLVVRAHGRVLCLEAVGSGVRLMILSELVKHYHGGIEHFDFEELSDEQREAALHFVFGQLGKGYDKKSGLRFALALIFKKIKREHLRNDEWFCSELVAEAFHRAGVKALSDRPSDYISPGDLLQLLPLKKKCTLKY